MTVNLNFDCAKTNESIFLIDTGSPISFFLVSKTKPDIPYVPKNKISFNGISGDPLSSHGTIEGNISSNGNLALQSFHLIKEDVRMQHDGLIGGDFLAKFQCEINYKELCLVINSNYTPQSLTIPIDSVFVTIPARSECVIKIPLNSENDQVITHFEMQPGLYIGNSIVHPEDGQAKTILLNTTEQDIHVSLIDTKFNMEPLDSYDVLNLDYSQDPVEKRLSSLESFLSLDHCNSEEKTHAISLCREYNDLFFLPGDYLTHSDSITHTINVGDKQPPINVRPYRLPHVHKDEINKQLQTMIESNIIRPSKSPWNSPLLIVPKKCDKDGNKKWRVVIDFRRLNDVTIGDAFPLPNITDILDQLGKSKYFTTLDLASGFHQVKMNPNDGAKTAFSSNFQHFEFTRMPFGLKGAPSTFQRLMNTVLTGLQGVKCFVYMDDIVIYACNLTDHRSKVAEVFNRLRQHKLKLQPEKCNFLRREIVYLGHVIGEDGILPDPAKIKAVQNFPTPKNIKEIKSFLGLAGYYHRFINNFSKISKPLTSLLRKDVTYKWDTFCDESFNILKKALITPPLLIYPDFSRQFIVTSDASAFAIGAVLSQGEIPNDRPICYASRTLSKAETGYSVIEKELLAIVYALSQFRPYIYGRKVLIVTDHKPLVWVMNLKDPSSRLMRWKIKIEEYDYITIYKKGSLNTNADSLSRIHEVSSCLISVKCDPPPLIEDVSDDESDSEVAQINVVQTRSSKKLLSNLDDITSKNTSNFELKENSKSTIRNADHNFQYYLMPNSDSNMYKTLSKVLNLEKYFNNVVELNNLIIIDVKKALIHVPTFVQLEIHKSLFRESVQLIKLHCQEQKFKNVAISIEVTNFKDLSEVKNTIISAFKDVKIDITIYLNKVQTITSEEEKREILKEYHDSILAGHRGVNQTTSKIKQVFFWENMSRDINNYVQSCKICQQNKVSRVNKVPMKITSTASRPFEKVFLDIVGPLPVSYNGNRYILTFQDDLTKYSEAFPIPNAEASTVAKEYVTKIICKFGVTESLLTDQGTNFMSNVFTEVCKSLKIHKIHTTAYHPQSNGALERSHRTLAEYLRSYVQDDQLTWDEWIPYAMFTYNTCVHNSTKFSPFELIFGTEAILPSQFKNAPTISYNYDNYANEMKARLQQSHQLARKHILEQKEKSKTYYDRNSEPLKIKIGDQVLLRNETRANKLEQIWSEPYPVVSIPSPENVTLLVKNKEITVHVNRIKKLPNN